MKRKRVYFIVDRKGWVQHRRVDYLRSQQGIYRFHILTANQFQWLWGFGMLRNRPIVFTTWRIVHKILKEKPNCFSESDFSWFLASVTSHSQIGGGLDPQQPIPNRTPEEAFRLAIRLLGRFKVVTANSRLLYDLLRPALPNVMYCPNGVNVDYFAPKDRVTFDNNAIRIGWVGKRRGAKNFSVVQKVTDRLANVGIRVSLVTVERDAEYAALDRAQMREFYHEIDYYLCASWNEGTPNPALEAGACGVPVITTRVGNMPELIVDDANGYFVDPTEESIVERCIGLKKTSEDRYRAMSKAIREAVETDFSWKRNIQYHIEAFDRLVR